MALIDFRVPDFGKCSENQTLLAGHFNREKQLYPLREVVIWQV
jgi:hypothetical protein